MSHWSLRNKMNCQHPLIYSEELKATAGTVYPRYGTCVNCGQRVKIY